MTMFSGNINNFKSNLLGFFDNLPDLSSGLNTLFHQIITIIAWPLSKGIKILNENNFKVRPVVLDISTVVLTKKKPKNRSFFKIL